MSTTSAVFYRLLLIVDVVVIDSLSTLMIYHKPDVLIRFISSMINKISGFKNTKLVLTMLEKDMESDVYKSVSSFVDRVIDGLHD